MRGDKMIQVYIIEDQSTQISLLTSILNTIAHQKSLTLQIHAQDMIQHDFYRHFHCNEEYITLFIINPHFHFALDDIELGKLIRSQFPKAYILYYADQVFHLDEIINAYISPVAYLTYADFDLLLNQFKSLINFILEQENHRYHTNAKPLIFHTRSQIISVRPTDLIYIEYLGNHLLRIQTEQSYFEVRGNLKDYVNLHDSIIQAHKSVLINRVKISKIDYKHKTLYLNKEYQVPIGSMLKDNLK